MPLHRSVDSKSIRDQILGKRRKKKKKKEEEEEKKVARCMVDYTQP